MKILTPTDLYTYEHLDKDKLNWMGKIVVWLIEYFARVSGAFILSLCLIIIAIVPIKSMSRGFFMLIGNVADMYRTKWMGDIYGKDNDRKKSKKDTKKKV